MPTLELRTVIHAARDEVHMKMSAVILLLRGFPFVDQYVEALTWNRVANCVFQAGCDVEEVPERRLVQQHEVLHVLSWKQQDMADMRGPNRHHCHRVLVAKHDARREIAAEE
jgi:hypothetical protein